MDNQKISEEIRGKVQDFLTQLGLDAEIVVTCEDETVTINLSGENLAELIGHRGRTLESVQTIFGLMINHENEERKRVYLEINDYRDSREKYLKSFALRAADDVRSSGQEVILDPMKPSERRILHLVLEQEEGIETESRGEGRDRRVVIKPKS